MKLLRNMGDGESRREGLEGGGRTGDKMETNAAPRPHVHCLILGRVRGSG